PSSIQCGDFTLPMMVLWHRCSTQNVTRESPGTETRPNRPQLRVGQWPNEPRASPATDDHPCPERRSATRLGSPGNRYGMGQEKLIGSVRTRESMAASTRRASAWCGGE